MTVVFCSAQSPYRFFRIQKKGAILFTSFLTMQKQNIIYYHPPTDAHVFDREWRVQAF